MTTETTTRINLLKPGDIFRVSNGSPWRQVIAVKDGRIEYGRLRRHYGSKYLSKENDTLPAGSRMIVERLEK